MRVLAYLPVTRTDGQHREWSEQIEALRSALEVSGGGVTVLAAALDPSGSAIVWPKSNLRYAHVIPPNRFESGAVVGAGDSAFEQLRESIPGHDVIWIPQPLGALPRNRPLDFAIPMVVGLHQLEFDRHDYGSDSDLAHWELARIFRAASGFLFPTRSYRDWATELDRKVEKNSGIFQAVGSRLRSTHSVPTDLGLPERYVLVASLERTDADYRPIVAGLTELFRSGRWELPLIWVHGRAEMPPHAGLRQLASAAAIRDEFRRAGMQPDRDWVELGDLEDWVYRGLAAGAAVVVGFGPIDSGPEWLAQSAYRSGVRLVHPRWEGYPDEPGTSWPFDPSAPADLGRAFREALASAVVGPRESSAGAAAATMVRVMAKAIEDFKVLRRPSVRRPKPRDERVAWLIGHTTLRAAEVPLLRELGYEVYTSKVLPSGDYRSGSADFSWDDDSTLPPDALAELNRFNFFQTEFDGETADTLNSYFGTVICAEYGPLIVQLLRTFRGRILVRAFGCEHPRTYAGTFEQYSDGRLWQRIWEIGRRFWFAACYEPIPPNEPKLLRERAVVLPVAMPERSLRTRGRWIGGDYRILFVCPSIGTAPRYYGAIYEAFRAAYGDLPYLVAGSQPIPVPDPNVTGFLNDERFQHLFRTMQVMYYHSREPRHIHYHPLEAIVYGMPVVYMRGGLMELFDTGSQAGACATDDEARGKLERVLAGDARLIAAIRASQVSILDIFLPKYNLDTWRRIFHETAVMPCDPAGLRDARPGSVAPAPKELDWPTTGESIPIHALTHEMLAGVRPVVEPARIPRRAIVRKWIPEALHPPARAVYRMLRGAKGSEDAPADLVSPPATPARERDATFLHNPPANPPVESLPPLVEPALDLALLRQGLHPDSVNFFLDPVGALDPNISLSDVTEQNLVVAFTELPWEAEESHGRLSLSASRQAKLWCRLARHAIFATSEDRALAIHRYGLDPARTSTLPILTQTEFPYPFPATFQPGEGDLCLPAKFLLGIWSHGANGNTETLFAALALLRMRKATIPPLVLAEYPPGVEWGRSSTRIERGIQERIRRMGLGDGENYFRLRGAAEPEHQWLLSRAAVSISNRRWGSRVVREITRASLQRVPCIASAIPAVVEAYGPPHENLLLVDPDDPVALARAIESALESSDENRARVDRAERIAKALAKPDGDTPRGRLTRAIAARLATSPPATPRPISSG